MCNTSRDIIRYFATVAIENPVIIFRNNNSYYNYVIVNKQVNYSIDQSCESKAIYLPPRSGLGNFSTFRLICHDIILSLILLFAKILATYSEKSFVVIKPLLLLIFYGKGVIK